ncbi:hypothetical protein C8J48_0928 [Desmospora activa DSM 45169]|uniref:Uncharacterized protein n=1 Tax=Desmospora activa DSM 45169 TaxID=1121389 RepID=A0A2T4Z8Y3_9BACL|nr:hypothetical protein C8J48_0928 [Desmospora activa DSM 45169]
MEWFEPVILEDGERPLESQELYEAMMYLAHVHDE